MELLKKNVDGILAFIIPFIIYVATLAPTVMFIDSGELKTAAYNLAIAHPTGYPLFTIVGKVLSFFPIGEPAYILNFMFALVTSIGCFVFYNFILLLFKHLKKDYTGNENLYKTISLAGTLTLAFSGIFWDSANHADVFGLQILIICTLLYIFTKAILISETNPVMSSNYFLLFAFLLGLGFGNHLSLIFMGVGLIYLYFATFGFNQISFKRLLIMGIPFIIGLTIYLYLPIRSPNTVSNWGNPHTWSGFMGHISGRQFSVWMFSGSENMKKQFEFFLGMYPKEFVYFPLLIAIPGILSLFKLHKKIFYCTALLFVFNVIYAINYDIYDIDHYFLLAFITTAIWISFGFDKLLPLISKNYKKISLVILTIPILVLLNNYARYDKSNDYTVQEYTFNVFETAPENSIIYSAQWDFFVAASYYYQYVKNIRPDLVIIDKELLRKSWYLDYVRDHYPEIYNRSFAEFEAYKVELLKFEKNTKRYVQPQTQADHLDLRNIQTTFANLQNSLVDRNYDDRPFFTSFEIEQNPSEHFGQEYFKIPEGVLIRYKKENESDNNPEQNYKYTIPEGDGYHQTFIRNAYVQGFLQRSNFLINKERLDEADELISKAIEIEPANQDAVRLRNVIQQMRTRIENTDTLE